MKTIISAISAICTSPSVNILLRTFMMPILFALITLTSCDKDDEDFSADVAKIVGTYTVADSFEDNDVENYSITISDAKDGGVQISNFGDIMYVPVKATIRGNIFNVPAQTFEGKSMTIVITGNGTLSGDQLRFDYIIDTGDDELLEHSCIASKN
jgi:F0F1-type ATP synthase beta subunit